MPEKAGSDASSVGGPQVSPLSALPALNPASVPRMKVGPLGIAPGQQYWFVTCSFGAAPDSKSMVTGAAIADGAASSTESAASAAPATRIAERAMPRR